MRHLYSCFCQAKSLTELFTHERVWVMSFVKQSLQFSQLFHSKVCPTSTLFSLQLFVVHSAAAATSVSCSVEPVASGLCCRRRRNVYWRYPLMVLLLRRYHVTAATSDVIKRSTVVIAAAAAAASLHATNQCTYS